jgi:hypothetical protein
VRRSTVAAVGSSENAVVYELLDDGEVAFLCDGID